MKPWMMAAAVGAALLVVGGVVLATRGGDTTPPGPADFRKVVLAGPFNQPVDMDVLNDGSVLFVEKGGRIYRWAEEGGAVEIGQLPNLYVSSEGNSEFGLVAIAADPAFADNGFVYMMYNPTGPGPGVLQRVARFTFDGTRIDIASERVLFEYASEPNCCHTGGGMEFDRDGLLYISTGDNTMPWSDDGYSPHDNRPDRVGFDAMRSAGNTNDMRGKVLRIRPTADGGYEIPAGNLFTDGSGLPEIYVMGARNPYTLSIDSETNTLYFGDVGPDGDADSPTRGPRGYDEVNRVTQAANTGWPLFIGANRAYHRHDYATGADGGAFDPAAPENSSPRNTGARILPPAQPALIAWPYGVSEEYPMLGEGPRNALVAGVYHRPRGAQSYALPRYFEDKLFIADFMRRWVMTLTLNADGTVGAVEPFAPGVELNSPLDFEFGPDGALYVLEYGAEWFQANPDSALSRIEYAPAAE